MNQLLRELETSVVKPIAATPRRRLWVSDLDIIAGRLHHVPTTSFYRCSKDKLLDFTAEATQLKESLSKVLVHFYPLAGRLARDHDNRQEVDCNEEGVVFVTAETDVTIDEELIDASPSEKLMRLVPKIDPTVQESSWPLLLVQLTKFKCGGICLGINLHHILADGQGAMMFINSWADLHRGVGMRIEPFLERSPLRPRDSSSPSFSHIHEYPSLKNKLVDPDDISKTTRKVFKITPNLINRLKATTPGYTNFEVMAAHIWRCFLIARSIPGNQESNFYTAVSGRARFKPPLPQNFFGNAVFRAVATATVQDLAGRPLSYAASMIHEAVAKVDGEYMNSVIKYLGNQGDSESLRGQHFSPGSDLKLVSWGQMGMENGDFGWGQLCFMGRAWVNSEGKAYLMPSTEEKGTFFLVIALQSHHIASFDKYLATSTTPEATDFSY